MTLFNHRIALFLVLLLIGSLTGCLSTAPAPGKLTVYRDAHLEGELVWAGKILIDGTVKVAKSATLTILPGTEVAFVRKDLDQDGLGDSTLVVEGALKAIGTRAQPIRFHSDAADPKPGDWLEIRVDFSREVHLRYCGIRDSAYTLHAHFTRGLVEDCTIHHNIDGCRLGQATFTFRNNLYEHNQGKGINFRNSTVEAHHNIIRYNGSGIFLFESDREFKVYGNNLYGNLDNFRLGDFYAKDVTLQDNWWGTADPVAAAATVYDRKRDETIGRVQLDPAAAWIPESGPRDRVELTPAWRYATGGYIDADLVADELALYAASWDGHLYALTDDGQLLWRRPFGDTLDATPVLDRQQILLQTWSREVYAVDLTTRETAWRFDYSPSRADDHRQGGLLRIDGLVLVPAWNGTLFALDRTTGERRWSVQAGQPLRARPAWDGRVIYLPGGDGTLTALSVSGERLWQQSLEAPLLTEPALLEDGVAVLNREGVLSAMSAEGRIRWQRDLAETCYYGAPVHFGRALYVPTAAGALWKIDVETGSVIWRVETGGPVYATPLVQDGRVYLGDNSGVLQVFGADSGSLLARFEIDREIQGRPLLRGQKLLFGSRDHHVHALNIGENQSP